MSKEERIQQRVAEKLGFRWTNGLMAPHTIDLPNGEPIQEADDYHRLLWVALVAAETKLEPQTVAETIDWEKEVDDFSRCDIAAETYIEVQSMQAAWLKSFVQRIHSSAPDTKGLAVIEAAIQHFREPEDREGYEECKTSNSLSIPVAWMELMAAVEALLVSRGEDVSWPPKV